MKKLIGPVGDGWWCCTSDLVNLAVEVEDGKVKTAGVDAAIWVGRPFEELMQWFLQTQPGSTISAMTTEAMEMQKKLEGMSQDELLDALNRGHL